MNWLLDIGAQRLMFAAFGIGIYLALCLAIARKHWAKRRGRRQLSGANSASWQIVYASQTGTAEELARQTADTLHLAGISVELRTLSELDAQTLQQSERILFVVSTYGEGNAPDDAALFIRRIMNAPSPADNLTAAPLLAHLHYALLALGDRSYTHFCGFGRELDAWLQARGAQNLFPALEAHQSDAATLDIWRHQLSHIAGTDDAPDCQGPSYDEWRLIDRRLLNPGSQGDNIFHLEFEPVRIPLPMWESGDLAQIVVPADPARPREYSIASIFDDGRIHLLVRLHRHPDGSFGAASRWLAQELAIGDSVPLRLRRHERFRLGDNAARPLILIGNGSGIAGLRGHLKARAQSRGTHTWLIFGERNAAYDFHYRAELEGWHSRGIIERLDVVFSRDQPERRYVQHRLIECADQVQNWIDRGAAIYVCGSLRGMAAGVDEALLDILGKTHLDELASNGRYRRDVY